MPRLASRDRLSFSRLPQVLELPDLIAVQRQSFQWFIEEGIAEVLADISPIEDFTGTLKLELADHVFDPPKHSEEECRDKDMTYARPLFVTARVSYENVSPDFRRSRRNASSWPLWTLST